MKLLLSIIFCVLGNYLVTAKTSSCLNDWLTGCSYTVSCNGGGSFSFTNEKLLQNNCLQGSIFWSYPQSNMTVKFTRDLQANEPFDFLILDTHYIYDNMPLYQIVNGQEVLVNTKQDVITLKSDSNNAVVIKSVGPTNLMYYGEFINFKIVNPKA